MPTFHADAQHPETAALIREGRVEVDPGPPPRFGIRSSGITEDWQPIEDGDDLDAIEFPPPPPPPEYPGGAVPIG
jgi:hypothetical protein